MAKLKIIKYHNDWQTFNRAHDTDAGLDCYLPEDVTIKPGMNKIALGFGIVLPVGNMGQIIERSSNAMNGLMLAHSPIDAGYTGEIHAIVNNVTLKTIKMKKNDRLGQLVLTKVEMPMKFIDVTENIPETARGVKGFGSSGR